MTPETFPSNVNRAWGQPSTLRLQLTLFDHNKLPFFLLWPAHLPILTSLAIIPFELCRLSSSAYSTFHKRLSFHQFAHQFHLARCDHNGDKCNKETYIFFDGMSTKLAGKDVQDLLSHPAALGERREGKVIRINLPQTCVC